MNSILPIPGFPKYAVSSAGNVWSFKRGKVRKLKPATQLSGHLQVSLRAVGKTTIMLVHRLVLFAFVGPPTDGMECRHLNGDPKDNRLENLCWGTKSENAQDSLRHGASRASRLTNEQIREIRRMPGRQKDIAAKFGISQGNVSEFKSGRLGDYSLRARKD